MDQENKKKEIFAIAIGAIFILAIGSIAIYRNFSSKEIAPVDIEEEERDIIYNNISAQELMQKVRDFEKLQIVDIDSEEDFTIEHIIDSINIPHENFSISELDSSSETVLIMRARDEDVLYEVASKIKEFSDKNIYYLTDGIFGWINQGGSTFAWVDPTATLNQSKVQYIEPEELKNIIDSKENIQLIDVRSQNEYNKERIPGAINIPSDDFEKRRSDVSVVKKVIFYSSQNYEAFESAVRIYDINIIPSYILMGGIEKWKEVGFDVEN